MKRTPTSGQGTRSTGSAIKLASIGGVAAPEPEGHHQISVRLAGRWREIWEMLEESLPGKTPTQIIREALAVRAAMVSEDALGKKAHVILRFCGPDGLPKEEDLEEYLGLRTGNNSSSKLLAGRN